MSAALFRTNLASVRLLNRGKVRDVYEVDGERLLIVATDRLSAFDVVLPTPIPGKGEILTSLSRFWFERLSHVVPNHLVGTTVDQVLTPTEVAEVAGRAVVVRRCRPLPIEAIVRGYLVGSGWSEYRRDGSVCGIALPPGLREADRLPEPIFTPSTKAAVGEHDENISFERAAELVGDVLARQVRDLSLALYREAAAHAAARGILIADTKFEFGVDGEGTLRLIDEALTPDSSRFWPAAEWQPGSSPPSFDKQYVRDWLLASGWNKTPPAPELPPEVAQRTGERYREALRRLAVG